MKFINKKIIAVLIFSSLLIGCNKDNSEVKDDIDTSYESTEFSESSVTQSSEDELVEYEIVESKTDIISESDIEFQEVEEIFLSEQTSEKDILEEYTVDLDVLKDFYDFEQNEIIRGEKECIEFLDALKNHDFYSLANLSRATTVNAYEFLNNVYISEWEIINKDYRKTDGNIFIDMKVKMNVYSSDSDMFPVGENIYSLTKSFGEDLYFFFYLEDEPLVNCLVYDISKYDDVVNFCYRFTTELGKIYSYDSINDFNEQLKEFNTAFEKEQLTIFMIRFCNSFSDE